MDLHQAATEPKSSDRTFGLLMAACFGLMAYFKQPAWLWTPIAIAFGLAALLFPGRLRPLHLGWLAFGNILQRIFSPVILAILFFGLFTPLGLIRRIFGEDALRRKMEPELETYWISRNAESNTGANMRRQF